MRGTWVPKGRPAPVESTCPRRGEQAGDSSAACPATGETEHMALTGTRSSATSAAFLRPVRATHREPLVVSWANGPAHGGDAGREYPATPALGLRVRRLPAYRPACNPAAASWARAREEGTATTRRGTTAKVPEALAHVLAGLADRTAAVPSRGRRKRHALAAALPVPSPESQREGLHGDPIGASA